MDERHILDYEFKKIYGRYPSTGERLQFKRNRPRRIYITGEDIDNIRKVKDVPTWKEQHDAWKRRNAPPVEAPQTNDEPDE